MSNYLSRDQILAAADVLTEDVDVPEWGGTVRVRGLTGTERDRFESQLMDLRANPKGRKANRNRGRINTENFRARLVAASIVDGDGQLLFGERDVRALGDKSAAALDRVMDVAMRLSGLTDEDAEELEGE